MIDYDREYFVAYKVLCYQGTRIVRKVTFFELEKAITFCNINKLNYTRLLIRYEFS